MSAILDSPHLSIAVNGADTPESIPDDLAAYHDIKASAILDDAPEAWRAVATYA